MTILNSKCDATVIKFKDENKHARGYAIRRIRDDDRKMRKGETPATHEWVNYV